MNCRGIQIQMQASLVAGVRSSVLISSTVRRIEGFAAQLYQPGNPTAATYVLPGSQSSARQEFGRGLASHECSAVRPPSGVIKCCNADNMMNGFASKGARRARA